MRKLLRATQAFPTLTINATCMICVNLGITKILQMNF